ncbi:hypothetical protein [Nocardia neocaledoniensis]|uniref:hypothetical protein n=1 Tax=Nocardia neocaledoniensis TaxID=236511 RepID=UPI002453C7B7|nr:hypothetical protein [Nocardia neocaledoniensis]
MKKTIAVLAVTAAALLAPAGVATAAAPEAAPVASVDEALCRLIQMLKAGYVDSSGGGPCGLASGSA